MKLTTKGFRGLTAAVQLGDTQILLHLDLALVSLFGCLPVRLGCGWRVMTPLRHTPTLFPSRRIPHVSEPSDSGTTGRPRLPLLCLVTSCSSPSLYLKENKHAPFKSLGRCEGSA